jgi:hypothetical protein
MARSTCCAPAEVDQAQLWCLAGTALRSCRCAAASMLFFTWFYTGRCLWIDLRWSYVPVCVLILFFSLSFFMCWFPLNLAHLHPNPSFLLLLSYRFRVGSEELKEVKNARSGACSAALCEWSCKLAKNQRKCCVCLFCLKNDWAELKVMCALYVKAESAPWWWHWLNWKEKKKMRDGHDSILSVLVLLELIH